MDILEKHDEDVLIEDASTMTFYMNIYRNGWFHRDRKPNTLDRHPGDLYASYPEAVAAIDPAAVDFYVATVPVPYVGEGPIVKYGADSIPTPLSVSRAAYHAAKKEKADVK